MREPFLALLVCAWIVAFFPIVSNTTVGLNSADRNLLALFRLYGASPAQTLLYLRLPTRCPISSPGCRISGGLALIGAVVAEFVAGTGGAETGLAFRILEAGYRLAIPRLFAALFLLSLTGIVIYLVLDFLSRRLSAATGTKAPSPRRRNSAKPLVISQRDSETTRLPSRRRLSPSSAVSCVAISRIAAIVSRGRRTASWSPSRSGTGRWLPASRSRMSTTGAGDVLDIHRRLDR